MTSALTPAELGALLTFATAMSFTPGPNTTLSAALAANHGLRRALRFVAAVPVGWALLLLAASAGVGALLQAAPALRGALKAAGVAYLLWLAWRLAHTGAPGAADARRFDVGFGRGVALQFVNLKAWLNALVISAGWVATGREGTTERLLTVLPLMMAYGFASNFTYALAGAALRRWLAQGARLLWFNRALAVVLAATAAWLAVL